jgi:hypothetical protein
MSRSVFRTLLLATAGAALAAACSGADSGSGNASGSLRKAAADGGSPSLQNGQKSRYCGADGCACANGIDDDGDGKADAEDAECVGAADDDEATYATGMPGDNRDPKWQDCFFDGNSGAGDDRCRYPTGCLTGEIAPTDEACAITEACLDRCMPLTPQNCDCFGCCTVIVGGASVDIVLSSSCTSAKLGDAKACTRCEKSLDCQPPPAVDAGAPPAVDAGPPPPAVDAGPPPPVETDSGTEWPPCDNGAVSCTSSSQCATGYVCAEGCCYPFQVE